MLLLAISGILGMVEGPPEKTRSNLLWAMAGGIPAFWDAPGTWAIIYLITFTILLVSHLRHRFGKVTLFVLIPVQQLLMAIQFVYMEEPVFKCLKEDTLFERKHSSYTLVNIRT
jgi:hypothetical protein